MSTLCYRDALFILVQHHMKDAVERHRVESTSPWMTIGRGSVLAKADVLTSPSGMTSSLPLNPC